MPLILQKTVREDTILALWKMEEDSAKLMDQFQLHNDEVDTFATFQIEKRRREWLVVRIMINIVLGRTQKIEYKENGQPFLPDSEFKISISHSKDYASIIVSKNMQPGIDIECISTRIEKIKFKFLSETEIEHIKAGDNYYKHMLAHWCAKEVFVKICGNRGIDFINKLKILPFEYATEGFFHGEILEDSLQGKYTLTYFEHDGYLIVWS